MRKGALGMDFESYARKILRLNDCKTINKTPIQKNSKTSLG